MCLDSDFFDLWRNCGDCNITQSDCQLSCHYCIAGEGIDTAELPAPRADQLLTIPSDGCSVDRRDYQLECRPQSEGNCGNVLMRAIPLLEFACLLRCHCFPHAHYSTITRLHLALPQCTLIYCVPHINCLLPTAFGGKRA